MISTHLPRALRTFLLTLAVVDDLLAIASSRSSTPTLCSCCRSLLALVPLALFGLLVQRRVRSWWLLLPLAVATWVLMHESGVHATVAGVLLGFTVPVVRSDAAGARPRARRALRAPVPAAVGRRRRPGVRLLLRRRRRRRRRRAWAPPSATASRSGSSSAWSSARRSASLGATWLVARFTRAQLDENLGWPDVLGLALLGGIGFTVSLLITELAYGAEQRAATTTPRSASCRAAAAALLATVVLRLRNRRYRRIYAEEDRDADADGIPDVYQVDDPTSDRLLARRHQGSPRSARAARGAAAGPGGRSAGPDRSGRWQGLSGGGVGPRGC